MRFFNHNRSKMFDERIRKAELAHSLICNDWEWTGDEDDKGIADGDNPAWVPPGTQPDVSGEKLKG